MRIVPPEKQKLWKQRHKKKHPERFAVGQRLDNDRNHSKRQIATIERLKKLNERLRQIATAHKRPWTAREDAILLRSDLTARNAAVLIGRTYVAVRARRCKLQQILGIPSIYPREKRKSRSVLPGTRPLRQPRTPAA